MPNHNDKVFRFASLADYSLKQRIQIRLADLVFFLSIKILGASVRFEVEGYEHLAAVEAAGKIPIYCSWHDRIFLATYFWRDRDIVVMTSKSFDAEISSRLIQRFGYGAIRGSSSRGGARALVEMVRSMRTGSPTGFTVDGPRGPRYEANRGPVILAKRSGNPLLPFVAEPRKFWTVNSWDKMQIPKPFTRAALMIGEPIYVDADAGEAEVEIKLAELQASLDDLNRRSKQWRGSAG